MPTKISTLLGVTNQDLEDKGVFDGFIDVDSHLHVDPSLLIITKIPEFQSANADFQSHFNNVLKLIVASKQAGDLMYNEAHKKLIFKEVGSTALGYSKTGSSGNGIGPKLALKILETVTQIVEAGIIDPTIFELVGVLEKNIGADRISDMTVNILLSNFASYTERVCEELKISTTNYSIRGKSFNLPTDPLKKTFFLLLPMEVLSGLPVAESWDDVDYVIQYNNELREKVNPMIGDSWKSALKAKKETLKEVILANPEILKDLLKQYKSKPRGHYDFMNDPLGEVIWADITENVDSDYPLDFSKVKEVDAESIYEVVTKICRQFASLVENNGWFEYLYNSKGWLKPERAPQLLFYGVAEVYCIANDFDLNREINGGVGSLDFKVSKGFNAKVNVEMKYAKNSGLVKGYKHQLPAYNRAEKTDHSIYLVIQTKDKHKSLDDIFEIEAEAKARGERVPEIIVIDGRKQLSASKRS